MSLVCQTCGEHLDEIADCPYCHHFPEAEDLAALRAENEFLAATLRSETAIKVEYEARIAELMAALRDARYLLENHASEKHILERIAAVLKGDAE